MPPRIPDSKRAEILADIRAGEKSCRDIARDHGVSAGTVSSIAKSEHVDGAFERSQTKKATEAKRIDDAALRVSTAHRFLVKANDLLDQMDQPHIVFNIGGKDNVYTEHLMDRPPTVDLRNLMVSAATAFDKHIAGDKHDADLQNLTAVDAWLKSMTGE